MRKLGNFPIYFTGSQTTINRVIYNDGKTFYIKWYGNFIEVENRNGIEAALARVTDGWRTKEEY
jgi:hypothetical protein